MGWFTKKQHTLWTTDAAGRRHFTSEGERQFKQWEIEGEIQRRDCRVHILDPVDSRERTETWLIGEDEVDRATYNQLRDDKGELYALVHYQAGKGTIHIVAKSYWEQALEAFK